MFGLNFTELVVILGVALLVLGPERLPAFSQKLGRTLNDLKRQFDDFSREMSLPRGGLDSWPEASSSLDQDNLPAESTLNNDLNPDGNNEPPKV